MHTLMDEWLSRAGRLQIEIVGEQTNGGVKANDGEDLFVE